MKLKQNSFLLLVTILLFFIMYGIGCVLFNAQGFSKTQNFLNLFISNAGLIVIGIGMTVVMITGGIDISVGSFVAMGCMMLAWMMEKGGIGAVPAVIILRCGDPCGAKQADYKKTYPVPEDQAGRASGILQ